MELVYQFVRKRTEFGKHVDFGDVPAHILDSIAPRHVPSRLAAPPLARTHLESAVTRAVCAATQPLNAAPHHSEAQTRTAAVTSPSNTHLVPPRAATSTLRSTCEEILALRRLT